MAEQIETTEPTQEVVTEEPAKIISLPSENLDKAPDITKDDDARYEKLMRENAEKRIRAKKAEETAAKLERKTKEQERILKDLAEKVTLFEKAEEERKLADASEIEKFTHNLEKAKQAIADYEQKLAAKDQEVMTLREKTLKQERQNFVDNLVAQNQIGFSSEYERKGFIGELLEKSEDGWAYNDEEIVQKILELKKQKFKPPVTPQEGPIKTTGEVPDIDRLKNLLAKPRNSWTDADRKELTELQMRISG